MAAIPHTPPVFTAPREFPASEDHRSCNICLDDFGAGIPLQDLTQSAAHNVMWHRNCLQTWLARDPRCPICRIPVTHLNGVPIAQTPKIPGVSRLTKLLITLAAVFVAGFILLALSSVISTVLPGVIMMGGAVFIVCLLMIHYIIKDCCRSRRELQELQLEPLLN